MIAFPQYSVGPCRRSRLLARVPVVGARVELVGRREGQLALGVTGENFASESDWENGSATEPLLKW